MLLRTPSPAMGTPSVNDQIQASPETPSLARIWCLKHICTVFHPCHLQASLRTDLEQVITLVQGTPETPPAQDLCSSLAGAMQVLWDGGQHAK
jgi:hypothetical protein